MQRISVHVFFPQIYCLSASSPYLKLRSNKIGSEILDLTIRSEKIEIKQRKTEQKSTKLTENSRNPKKEGTVTRKILGKKKSPTRKP